MKNNVPSTDAAAESPNSDARRGVSQAKPTDIWSMSPWQVAWCVLVRYVSATCEKCGRQVVIDNYWPWSEETNDLAAEAANGFPGYASLFARAIHAGVLPGRIRILRFIKPPKTVPTCRKCTRPRRPSKRSLSVVRQFPKHIYPRRTKNTETAEGISHEEGLSKIYLDSPYGQQRDEANRLAQVNEEIYDPSFVAQAKEAARGLSVRGIAAWLGIPKTTADRAKRKLLRLDPERERRGALERARQLLRLDAEEPGC